MTEPSDPSTARPRELTGPVGKYEISRPIGKGAMGQVFLARDTILERDVALKVMSPQIVDDPELKARFEREAKAIARMTHPNVVTVFDLGHLDDSSPYIAMELLKGQDLQKTMRQLPPMTLERKVSVIVQVLAGLAHAHQQGIVHRDIKPANIFIVRDESVKITDFGVAHLATSSMTGTGSVVGTADYMSPEQVKGDKIDGRSDLFSVGCMLFELVTGRRPFHSDNLMAIFYKITHERPDFDSVPAGVEFDALLPILKKALARSVGERYQSAAAFAVALRDWLRAHATTASSQDVLEALIDLEAPTHAPQPMTEAPGRTVVPVDAGAAAGATGGLGTGRRSPGPPRRSTTGTGRVGPPSVPRRRPRRVHRRNPLPQIALVVAATATAAGLGYMAWRARQPAATPPVTPAATPPVAQAPPPVTVATPEPPPPTAAPQPTFPEAEGQAVASVRRAQDSFRAGRYERAVESAQQALREDPSNTAAQQVLDNALNGQKATARLRAGEAALARGDFPAAEREAGAARALAPWEQSVVDLGRRIDTAKVEAARRATEQARQEDARRIGQLIEQGTTALAARQYDDAVAAYDRALQLDPGNQAAAAGKSNAVAARAMAETAASRPPAPAGPAPRGFVASGSVARGSASGAARVPPGFEATPEVEVHQGSQAAALPGELMFEVSPTSPKAGERYSVTAYLLNEGSQPIPLDTMVITTTIDGKKQQGRVAPTASVVAPRQRAPVFQLRNELWKQGTQSWEMEIVVVTSQRETYRNTLTWK